ncbi:heavy-metal-associated domain-containing protein [Phaeovulum sp. W22_SRMD_FR3]|uniref:heavy-metal-associated domain-containing protein n=1 Tax=Phaeovulum sp. W22_SRMD_FR3 TaxID=3240274 RepID=UPI003F94E723
MTTFHIPDMSCGHCKSTVDKTIHSLDPSARIEFDMPARKVFVESNTDGAAVVAALMKVGFPASVA